MVHINHSLIKIHTKNANNLTNSEVAAKLIEDISNLIGTTIIDSSYNEFGPSGLTGFALLRESHIAIHTWPEYNMFILDILSCKKFPDNFEERAKELINTAYNVQTFLFENKEIVD